nr:hypothetical protein [Tanacetum cinerariifolium]
MAQPQRPTDLHQEKLCPPNKRYALMDANKKMDLDNTEGLHYSLEHLSTLIPYPRFTKHIVSHCMHVFLDISRRDRDKCHNLDDDMMVKNICNSRKHKDGVGMEILSWMITDEMKLTDNYQMYAAVFGVDVPTSHSKPIESTQGTHRIISSPSSPNPAIDEGESIEEHLIAEEIEKFVEGAENVENVKVDSSTLRIDDTQTVLGTRLESKSNKESLEVEITAVEQPVNVIEEKEGSPKDDYELKRKEKGKHVEESRITPPYKKIDPLGLILLSYLRILNAIQQKRENLHAEISSQITNAISNHIPSHVYSSVRNYISSHILHEHPTQATPASAQEQQYHLYLAIKGNPQLQQDDLPIWLALNAKRSKTSEHGTYVFGESSSGQDYKSEPGPSTSGNQEQLDDFNFWTDSYATYDDEIRTKKVSQELVNEMSQTIDVAKLRKMQNFLKNDIVWESRKEILVSPHPQRPTPVVQICQRDPKAPALSLVNHDLLYLKKGSSGSEKIVMCGKLSTDVNLTAPTITLLGIKKYKGFSIVFEPVYGIIYKNNKKEKRVMRHQDVHKFYGATIKRVLEGLKSYNNNVKHGYVTPSLSNEDAKFL